MNWFQDIKTSDSQLVQEEISELLKSKIEKLLEKLPKGYKILKTPTGWNIIGPNETYSVEKNPRGWGVTPKGNKEDSVIREEKDPLRPGEDPSWHALELAIPRIKFRDAIVRLQRILKNN
jgi:hypothetical protein